MKRLVFAVAIAVMLAGASVFAVQSGSPKPPKPRVPAAKATKPATPVASAKPHSPTSKPQPPKSAAPKAAAATKPTNKATGAPLKNAGATKPDKTTVTTTANGAKPVKRDTTTTLPPGTTLTPVQEKLVKSSNLARKVESRLPAGTNVLVASEGFKNLGQFVAAVNVSNNLNIPFDKLKDAMVKDRKSLGQAIQALRPTSSGTIEAQRAEYDARSLIVEAEREAAVVAASTKPKTKTPPPSKPGKPTASPRASGGRP